MTTCQVLRDGCRYKVDITGHAGYNPGHDIVCAAVSMLAYTYIQCIRDMEESGDIVSVRLEYLPGDVHVDAVVKERSREHIEEIISVIETGFVLLQHQYPGNVVLLDGVGELQG